MSYKDKDKQREANAERQRRYKAKHKGVTSEGVTVINEPSKVTPKRGYIGAVPEVPGLTTLAKPELTAQGNIRVSKPGDDDYVPQCETTRAFIDGRDKRGKDEGITQVIEDIGVRDEVLEAAGIKPKRGKDIKTFADLPPDVQEVIHKLSTIDGKIDQRVKANRTAIAVNYQHQFPDRYNSTGVA